MTSPHLRQLEPLVLLRLVVGLERASTLRRANFYTSFTKRNVMARDVSPRHRLLSAAEGEEPLPFRVKIWSAGVADKHVTADSPVFSRALRDWPRLVEDVCVLCRPGCELEAEDALREYVRRVLTALLRSQHNALGEESQLASLLAETLQAIAAPRCPELPL